MSGCWEITQQSSVLVAVLHVDTTTVAWSFGLRGLIVPNGQVIGLTGMPFDMSRNTACMRALECGASHIFFLDSDVVPPRDAILKLLAHRQHFISGLYCRRSPPQGVPVAIKDGKWLTQYPPNTVMEVDLVGAGCLLISRELLQSIPPQRKEVGRHWFDWRVDMRGLIPEGEALSEDFTLCQHIRRHGHKVLLDTSIQCKHIGFGQATFGKFEPLEATAIP